MKEKGYKIVVVTNQSAVARGRLTEEQLKQIHEEVRARLARAGATLGLCIVVLITRKREWLLTESYVIAASRVRG